jgi:hypothetical protein
VIALSLSVIRALEFQAIGGNVRGQGCREHGSWRRSSSWRWTVRDEAAGAGRRAWSPGGVRVNEDAEVSENQR